MMLQLEEWRGFPNYGLRPLFDKQAPLSYVLFNRSGYWRETLEKERRLKMVEFRRRQESDRWHWSKQCSDYPTEKDIISKHIEPEYGILCEECQEKEPLREPVKESK